MKFIVDSKFTGNLPTPCLLLVYDKWDDFSFKTAFTLIYRDNNGHKYSIGYVKILHLTEKLTINKIDSEFLELSDDFCSLGQEIDYYENFKHILPDSYLDCLNKLNDAAFHPPIREVFENHRGFINSLLRSSEAEKCLNQARMIIEGIPIDSAFNFNYSCQITGASSNHTANINFAEVSSLPNRIVVLIGKNGTGKTQFLANLALDLGGKRKKLKSEDSFTPHRPLFSKIIAISYSVFDKFARPSSSKSVSYKYCGLKDEKGYLSPQKLIENYEEAVTKIREYNRVQDWTYILSAIIGESVTQFYYQEIFISKNYAVVNQNSSRLLSSGQSFLMYVITEVIANIRKDSLLLFDEPEMHLHPDAIANLIRMIDRLLKRYDSYAILATHSPIILQEIPSRFVRVFEREGNIPRIRQLGSESFGENIEALTEDVFQTKNVEGTYKEVLRELKADLSYQQVLELFENRLSLNAKTYLAGLYDNLK